MASSDLAGHDLTTGFRMEGKLLRLEFLSPMYDVLLKPGETTLEVRARIAAGIRRDAVAGRAKGAMVEPAPPASQIDA